MPYVINPNTKRVISTRGDIYKQLKITHPDLKLTQFSTKQQALAHQRRQARKPPATLERQREWRERRRQARQLPPPPPRQSLEVPQSSINPLRVTEEVSEVKQQERRPDAGAVRICLPSGGSSEVEAGANRFCIHAMLMFLGILHENSCVPTIAGHITYIRPLKRVSFQQEPWVRFIQQCSAAGKRFILSPLFVRATMFNANEGHVNMLIFDTVLKQMERFEPHGKEPALDDEDVRDYRHMDEVEMPLFARQLGFSYLSPKTFCPADGPQYIQFEEVEAKGYDSGFCAYWSFWYAHLRLEFPNIPQEQLIKRAMRTLQRSGGRQPLHKFIRDYASFFSQFTNRLAHPRDIQTLAEQFKQARGT